MNRLCELKYDQAVSIVEKYEKVWYQRGVWNEYKLVSSATAIEGIMSSGYGADVYEDNGEIFVSCPVSSDMW